MLCSSAAATLRNIRRLSTTATLCHIRRLSTTTTTTTGITISKAKSQLRSDPDPDMAFEMYCPYKDPDLIRLSKLNPRYVIPAMSDLIEFQESQPNENITREPYLSHIIRTYGVVDMFDAAIYYYRRMDQLGTPRTSISFNALLYACESSSRHNNVPNLFEKIIQQYGVVPDEVSYRTLIRWFCNKGQPEKALEILKEVEEKNILEITACTCTILLTALYRKNLFDEAEKLWSSMKEKGCIDVEAYNVRLNRACDGVPEKVKAMIDEMVDLGLKPNMRSYYCLIRSYWECGMVKEAKEVYAGLDEKGCDPDLETYRTLLYYLCMNKDFEEGFKVFKETENFLGIHDFRTLKLLAQGLMMEGKEEKAKDLIRIVKMTSRPKVVKAWAKVEKNLNLSSNNDGTH